MYHVCIAVAAALNIELVNKLISMVINPNTAPAVQLSVGLCPEETYIDPEGDPFGLETHWLAAWVPIDHQKLTAFQNLTNDMPTPPNGWPWVVNNVEYLTEAQAITAAGSVTFYAMSQADPDNQLQHTLLTAVKNATGLKTLDV